MYQLSIHELMYVVGFMFFIVIGIWGFLDNFIDLINFMWLGNCFGFSGFCGWVGWIVR
jgi:hypothetical protein